MNNRIIIGGPCIVQFGTHYYETEGDVTVTPNTKARVIVSSLRGPVSRRVIDRTVTVSFTPLGRLLDTAAYYPYGPADLGKLIAPAQDADIVIWGADGQKVSYHAAVLTGSPDLILSAAAGPFGQMTLTGMGALTKQAGTDASMFTAAAAALATSGYDYDLSSLHTPGYKLVIGADTIDSKAGFTFTPGLTFEAVAADAYGTANFRLTAFEPALTFVPVGPDVAKLFSLLKFQGAAAPAIGAANSLGLAATVSPVSGDGVTLSFADCQLSEATLSYGAGDRLGAWTLHPAADDAGTALYTVEFPAVVP